jgi:SprT protein
MAVQLRNKVVTAKLQNPHLFSLLETRIKECFDILNQKLGLNIQPETSEMLVCFDQSTKGGYVWPDKHGKRVFLNWVLAKENTSNYLTVVIPHEVCHIFQRELYPISSSHGSEWKRLMIMIGLPPQRCHAMDTSRAGRHVNDGVFTYICNCRKHYLTKIKHNRMASGQRRYLCRECRKELTFLSEK